MEKENISAEELGIFFKSKEDLNKLLSVDRKNLFDRSYLDQLFSFNSMLES